MLYIDYKKSADKHEYTCEVLLEKIRSFDVNSTSHQKNKYESLILNFYYISGYIIECIVKYGIYVSYKHDRNLDVDKFQYEGYTYKKNIKFHRYTIYTELLNKQMTSRIPLVSDRRGIDKNICYLYDSWDSVIRYSCELRDIAVKYYIAFYDYSKKIKCDILKQVDG